MSWVEGVGRLDALAGVELYMEACGYTYQEAGMAMGMVLEAAWGIISDRGDTPITIMGDSLGSEAGRSWVAVPLDAIAARLKDDAASCLALDRRDVGIVACALASDPAYRDAARLVDVRVTDGGGSRMAPCLVLGYGA